MPSSKAAVIRNRMLVAAVIVLLAFAAQASAARIPAHQQAWQYKWRVWLPANWYRLGSCETGYGGPPNWQHHNRLYVSAFGISRVEYDADARFMGAPPWDDARPPSPWHQYRAALGHYRRFGDGWGCPGP